jgi:hypothetical protein
MLHILDCRVWLPKQFVALQLQAGLATVLAVFQLRTFAVFGWSPESLLVSNVHCYSYMSTYSQNLIRFFHPFPVSLGERECGPWYMF